MSALPYSALPYSVLAYSALPYADAPASRRGSAPLCPTHTGSVSERAAGAREHPRPTSHPRLEPPS